MSFPRALPPLAGWRFGTLCTTQATDNNPTLGMIYLNRKEGYIRISRCDYLYRNGELDERARAEMSDGDILIPLPAHMTDTRYDDGRNGQPRKHGSDGQSAEIIFREINRRLKRNRKSP